VSFFLNRLQISFIKLQIPFRVEMLTRIGKDFLLVPFFAKFFNEAFSRNIRVQGTDKLNVFDCFAAIFRSLGVF
jgi:hypothetical protein